MASHSKMQDLLVAVLKDCTCLELFHPFTNRCSMAVLDMAWAAMRGANKYFSIIYVLQLLLKGREADREYLKTHLIGYVRSVIFGSVIAGTFVAACCAIRAMLGRYYLYTAVALPGAIAGLTIFIERPVRRDLYSYTFVQAALEYLVRLLEVSGIGPMSTRNETIVFMLTNAILLYLLKEANSKQATYWFFKPPSIRKKNTEDTQSLKCTEEPIMCSHKEPCKNYILKSIFQYAGAGVGIQILRSALSKMKYLVKAPSNTLKTIVWSKDTFKLGAFLGAYIGIYKCVSCLLCQQYRGDSNYYALPAGLLAGSAYYLNPERAFGLSAITTVMLMSVRRSISRGLLPDMPFMSEMTFIISSSILFHARFVDAENCPRFIMTTLATVTRGRSEYIYRTYVSIFEDFVKSKIVAG